jgi:hypothetical protein
MSTVTLATLSDRIHDAEKAYHAAIAAAFPKGRWVTVTRGDDRIDVVVVSTRWDRVTVRNIYTGKTYSVCASRLAEHDAEGVR